MQICTLHKQKNTNLQILIILLRYILICHHSCSAYYQLWQLRPLVRMYVSRGRKDAGPGVHFVSPGLLQLAVLWHHRWPDEPAAVCPECGCTSVVGCTSVRPHHAGATGAALASGSTSGGVQDCHSGLPVTVRHGPSLSGYWLGTYRISLFKIQPKLDLVQFTFSNLATLNPSFGLDLGENYFTHIITSFLQSQVK